MEKTERNPILTCKNIWGPPWAFKKVEEEQLYTAYTRRQQGRAVTRLLKTGLLLQCFTILVPGERNLYLAYGSVAVWIVVNLTLKILHDRCSNARPVLTHVVWFILWLQLLLSAARRIGDAYNELLGWAAFLQYFTLAAIPLSFPLKFLCSLLSIIAYPAVQTYNALSTHSRLPDDFIVQQLANVVLLLGATILGGISYTIGEWQQRSSFQETKKNLLDKLTIEQQSKEQERLLLSVLPEHVAVQMRQELGLIDTQFKKIYMSRHENVSILYADIVGFTAISSTYSAQDLVAILNELFARFDRLSEKYHQLRIKILGDCYYCISGAPVERPDHAVLCVHMGLSMVKAIKYVQQTTNSPVDMRVGIHTGAILAGVLGQRQWQFDVYSRDVELANKMESSGMAGRVHISEVTLSYLQDEFEVEPAHGERREEMLRQAGIKTYFIVRVLKPFQGDEKSAAEGEGGEGGDTFSDLRDDDEDSVLSPQDENKHGEKDKILAMLQEELVNRDDTKELKDATTKLLKFKSEEVERAFFERRETCLLTVVAPPFLLVPTSAVLATFAVPTSWALYYSYLALIIEIGLVNLTYITCFRFVQLKKNTLSPYWRLMCGIFNMSMFVAANIVPLLLCGLYETAISDTDIPRMSVAHSGARRCQHPSYYYHVAVGAGCGLLWISPLGQGGRIVSFVLLTVAHIVPVVLFPELLFKFGENFLYDLNDANKGPPYESTPLTVLEYLQFARLIVMMLFIVPAFVIFNRYMESVERARHSRGQRMRGEAERAADLRRRNLALVHNVLPPHVASHFMGAKHHHRDLYSQSYGQVGVLFASMPNFSEFYSEESVNNQGLECLRFLNEVISDFDLLLEDPKFCKDIIKIKTIGSTYMAASGLNPTRQIQASEGVVVVWAHLACLVEFALELQRVLAAINEQSFNHFVLRLGVNHGPITAGVIGACKPHYDIWGNTVNVASRMESTGKAGCIQVTEETCHILQSFGYFFEQRGLVAVKGKGQLMTYYLQGKKDPPDSTNLKTNVEDGVHATVCDSSTVANGGTPARSSHDDIEANRPLLPP